MVAERGESALQRAGRAGRRPRLSEKQHGQLVARLLEGPEKLGYDTPLWTCRRVARLIEQEFGVRYHAGHVWKLLRELNWPAGRAWERDDAGIDERKRRT